MTRVMRLDLEGEPVIVLDVSDVVLEYSRKGECSQQRVD